MISSHLNPTLWRTCRVLANPTRLRILSCVMNDGPTTVTMIMRSCALSEPRASQHLRLLQSRGLLSATRTSRWIHYVAQPDPLVPDAARLLKALRQSIRQGETSDNQIQALTALTHVRRILIVRALHQQSLSVSELIPVCQISRPALYRHLAKLEHRGWVARDTDEICHLTPPAEGLAHALLALALASPS